MKYQDKRKQIDELHEKINSFGELSTEVKKKINYKFRLDWNYFSNSMEGNTLTMDETRSVMVGNLSVGGKPLKDVLEMKGHDDVVIEIMKIGRGELRLSESRIKQIHQGIMNEEDEEKKAQIGQWKKIPNYVINYKKERFDFADPSEVSDKIHDLLNKVNAGIDAFQQGKKDAPHPIDIALNFHLDYLSIHPFYDGNGRTARILTNLILISLGYPPFWIKTEERKIYYQYLGDVQCYGGKPDLLFGCLADMILRSEQLTLDAIEGKDIEEADDIDKEVALFKQEAKGRSNIKVQPRSGKRIFEIYKTSVKPLFDRYEIKHRQFEDLFSSVKKQTSFNGGYRRSGFDGLEDYINYLYTNSSNLVSEENLHAALEKNDFKNFTAEITFIGYLNNGLDTFDIKSSMYVVFEDFKYEFVSEGLPITKAYSEDLTEVEMNKLLQASVKGTLERIKKRLEESRKWD